jgi:hypothetical protein
MFHAYASADAEVPRLDERIDLANGNHRTVNGNAKDRIAALDGNRYGCSDDFH